MRKNAMTTRGKLNPTEHEISYLAGILDADGCISIYKCLPSNPKQKLRNPRYVLYVVVTSTSKALMNWLVEKFGGHYKARKKVKIIHKTTYSWFFNNGKAAELLKLVEPKLLIKKDQAIVGIQFIDGWQQPKPGQLVSDAEISRREAHCAIMRKLNQTGDTAATTESLGSCTVHRMMRQSELMGNHERGVEAPLRRASGQ
jgi:hypothetical protein